MTERNSEMDQELVEWAKQALRGLPESGIFVGVYNEKRGDERPEFLLQLGYCIMKGKPIILPVAHGMEIPPKLVAVADCIVRYDPSDMSTLTDAVAIAIKELKEKGR